MKTRLIRFLIKLLFWLGQEVTPTSVLTDLQKAHNDDINSIIKSSDDKINAIMKCYNNGIRDRNEIMPQQALPEPAKATEEVAHPTRDNLLNHVRNLINAFERLGPRTPTMIEVEQARAYIGQRKNEQRAE